MHIYSSIALVVIVYMAFAIMLVRGVYTEVGDLATRVGLSRHSTSIIEVCRSIVIGMIVMAILSCIIPVLLSHLLAGV